MSGVNWTNEKAPSHEAYASSTSGILLLNSSLNVVAFNSEAAQILAFPSNPEHLKNLAVFITGQIRSKIAPSLSIEGQGFIPAFKSGKRTYQCRAMNLQSGRVSAGTRNATVALLFERQPSAVLSLRRVCKEFDLAPRECQTVELLLQGMTTKGIANAMDVSPNTVKTYLRLIMSKMRVSTRTGIIAKILSN